MKRIDEKVAISGDGAELIQSYLNELNMKLLAAGITESYSVVMEAETLFISEINELNKKTKVTVFEVQKIIEKHGTPDEIVKRYTQASEALMDEEFYSMDPQTKELIKRSTNLNSDLQKMKGSIFHIFGLLMLVLPPVLFGLALIHLNQYEGNFILFVTLLDITHISDDQAIVFVIVGSILFMLEEYITGMQGKLFVSLRNTIRVRTFNRTMISVGAFASYCITRLPRSHLFNPVTYNYDREHPLPYSEDILIVWIIFFILTESGILVRDHVSSLYPLQPRFVPYQRFLKIHYILMSIAVILTVIYTGNSNGNILLSAMVFGLLAILFTMSSKFNPGPRFYFIGQIIPMLGVLNYNESRFFMYVQPLIISLILSLKYRKDIKLKTKEIIDVLS